MAALHELRDKGLIEGRNGHYSRYRQAPCEWHAVRPWPLCYCSRPKIATEAVKKRIRKHAYDTGVPWSERTPAKKFVPIDGEPEDDHGLVDRAPTSVGKGQRRLDS